MKSERKSNFSIRNKLQNLLQRIPFKNILIPGTILGVTGVLLLLLNISSKLQDPVQYEEFKFSQPAQPISNQSLLSSLDILPQNYLEVVDGNNLIIEQKSRVELLRFGKSVVTQKKISDYNSTLSSLVKNQTPILVNDQILSIYYVAQTNQIQREIIQNDLKKQLESYLYRNSIPLSLGKWMNISRNSNRSSTQSILRECIDNLNREQYTDCVNSLKNLDVENWNSLLLLDAKRKLEKLDRANTLIGLDSILNKENSNRGFEEVFLDNSLNSNDTAVINSGRFLLTNNKVNIPEEYNFEVDINNQLLQRMTDKISYTRQQLDSLGIRNSRLIQLNETLEELNEYITNPSVSSRKTLGKILSEIQYRSKDSRILLTTIKKEEDNILYATPYIEKESLLPAIIDNNFADEYDIPPLPYVEGAIRLPVLMYHNISEPIADDPYKLYVSPEVFERQIAYLVKKNYKTIDSEEFNNILTSQKNPTQKTVMLTFDDATPTHYSVAYPILKKYGQKGVFFVIASRSLLNHTQIKEMSDGGMDIQSHSNTHKTFSAINNQLLTDEIVQSKAILEGVTGKKITLIAYPGCNTDYRGMRIAEESGYTAGFSCGRYIDLSLSNRYYLSRVHVYNDMESFIRMLSVGL